MILCLPCLGSPGLEILFIGLFLCLKKENKFFFITQCTGTCTETIHTGIILRLYIQQGSLLKKEERVGVYSKFIVHYLGIYERYILY